MEWHPRRRPIWQPSHLSRVIHFLGGFFKQLTLKRVALALVVVPLLLYVFREVRRDALVIDPFSVPKQYEEAGLTPEVIANRIGNSLRKIEADAKTVMKKDNLESLRDEGSTPDVEIPGTKLGLKTLVDITRAVLGVYPKHVSGDIVVLVAPASSSAKPQVRVTVYLTQGRDRSRAFVLDTDANDMDTLASATAEMILGQVNPYVLAVHRYDHGQVDGVEKLLLDITQDPSEDPKHVSAAFNFLGNVLDDQNKYAEAIVKFQKAIELDPKFAMAYNNWGYALDDRNKYDEAIVKFQKAIDLDPKLAMAYNNWGYALDHQHKYDEAIIKYQKAIDLDPKDVMAYNNWGNSLDGQEKYDEAVLTYQKAIELDPKYTFAYNNWGVTLFNQHKYDEAIIKYQKAIELDPKYANAYYNWGNSLYGQHKSDEAIIKYQRAIELDPKYANAYYNWGVALKEQGKPAEAEEKLAKARELSQ